MQTTQRGAVIALLSAFSLTGYVLRMNISVAAPFMMADLHLDKVQMGLVFSAFMWGYALFQVPWGVSGDRLGPGRTLTWAAALWAITTALTGLLPGWVAPAGLASLVVLMVVRFALGMGQAAAFPVASRAIVSWMPDTRRAQSFAVLIVGMAIGSAFTPPLVSWAMTTLGWRASFYLSALLAVALWLAWRRSAGAHLDAESGATPSAGPWYAPLRDKNVAVMCVSYFFDSYLLFVFVYWLYLYLVEQRGMSLLTSAVYTGLPFALAVVFAPIAGWLCDWLSVKIGRAWGRRAIAIASLVNSAGFLVVGINVGSQTMAVAGLSLAVAFLLCTETAYWSAAMDLGESNTGTVGGIMNMAGNFGGVVSTSLMPVLIERYGWTFAFRSAAGLALVAAALWMFVSVPTSAPKYPRP